MPTLPSTGLASDLRGRVIGRGRQSQVELTERGHMGMPTVIKKMGVGRQLSYEEARCLHAQFYVYRDILKLSGWSIPDVYDAALCGEKDGLYIRTYEEYIDGQSVSEVMYGGFDVADKKWEICGQLFSLLSQQRGVPWAVGNKLLHRLPYGVDLKPDNLVLDSGGRVYLVDIFGPKTIDDRGRWVSYARKLERLDEVSLMIVTATREGAILRFLRLAARGCPVGFAETEAIARLRDCLLAVGISSGESEFIVNEVSRGYPWLDELYGTFAGS